jgi:ribose transport system ATP-binding protein
VTLVTASDALAGQAGSSPSELREKARRVGFSQYPGVRVLAGADVDTRVGDVHALVGENRAGKSTLIKVPGCACHPNAGTITVGGQTVR